MDQKHKIIVMGGVVALALIIGLTSLYIIFRPRTPNISETLDKSSGSAENITDSADEGVVDINTNPLKNAPDTNPVVKTNPYSDIKTNPFE